MPTDTCGSTDTTTGEPCGFPVPHPECPFHGEGEPPDNGRPSTYDPDVADEVCERMAAGETLRGICRDEDMPPESTVRRWSLDDRDGFHARYTRARKLQVDHWADEVVDIADVREPATAIDPESGAEVKLYDSRRDKLRVDTRKWLMSKLNPEKYGKRQKVEHSGPEGGPIEVDVDDARQRLTEQVEQLARREAVTTNGSGD